MAPMRDLICGGCDVVVCDMVNSPPFVAGAFSPTDNCSACRQSAMPERRDQPENVDLSGYRLARFSGFVLHRSRQPLPERRELGRIRPGCGRDEIETGVARQRGLE